MNVFVLTMISTCIPGVMGYFASLAAINSGVD